MPNGNQRRNVTSFSFDRRPTNQSDAVRRGNRTRRLNKATEPFTKLDEEAAEIQRRIDLDEADDDHMDRNIGRVILQALALRKDLELAKDKRIEMMLKLDEVDVRSELEELKSAIQHCTAS